MSPTLRHESPAAQVWEGDCRAVAAGIEPGSCSLAVLDGPYAMQKAAWDRMKVADLPEWYAPHLDDVDRVCAPSASLYVWNTAEGWATLHPGIVGRGWTFRALVVWDKTIEVQAGRGTANFTTWANVSEYCGVYQRSGHVRELRFDLAASRKTRSQIDSSVPWSGSLVSRWLEWPHTRGSCFPNFERFCDLWRAMGFPASTAGSAWLRHRPPMFIHPRNREGNVWRYSPVSGAERLRDAEGDTLHPCQKPLAFADRILRASMRPGETAWVPFGGTLREAVAAERIARAEPHELRRVITAELNQDGVDYIGPALRQLRGEGTKRRDPRQGDMFARGEP